MDNILAKAQLSKEDMEHSSDSPLGYEKYPSEPVPEYTISKPSPSSPKPTQKHKSSHPHEELPFCSTTSKLTGNFVDLTHLTRKEVDHDWHIRGLDLPYNFTVNICNPVLASIPIEDVNNRTLVSALYVDKDGRAHSLGEKGKPHFRGRSLLLEYENGSPCMKDGVETPFRMSSTFLFKCDRETNKEASLSFVSQSNNCSFFFEVKTPYACPSLNTTESMGPLTIFFIITFIAVLVYSTGTFLYKPAINQFKNIRRKSYSHIRKTYEEEYS